MSVQITFCGAAGTVTGSCYWIQHDKGQFLVDCGMFQGPKTIRELNYKPFYFDPAKIDCVLLTHAHIDHSGLIPKLFKAGFKGAVFTTEGTRDLLTYMLPDSGHIQETEVEHLNRRNAQRNRPAVTPIYTLADAQACLAQIKAAPYNTWVTPVAGIKARWWNAGHILGSASIELEVEDRQQQSQRIRLLFSGDIGPEHSFFLPQAEAPNDLDYLLCETTYGNRKRQQVSAEQRRGLLAKEIAAALERGGDLLIPTFAIERTQELLLDITTLMREERLAEVPIFLDSPLAIKATQVFSKHLPELVNLPDGGDPFQDPGIHFTETVEESKAIARFNRHAIIMAASGMCDAGRIRHHLKHHLWRHDSTVLLVGYQAPGTLGWLLSQGKRSVRIHGEEVAVRATIREIDVYSGHADQTGLLGWVRDRLPVKRCLFLTHGEEESRKMLREFLISEGLPKRRIRLPHLDQTVELSGPGTPKTKPGSRRLPARAMQATDWHNDYSDLLLAVRDKLHEARSDEDRAALIARLKRAVSR